MDKIKEKFRDVSNILDEIDDNFKEDLIFLSEICEKYGLEVDEIETIGFNFIINRMVIARLVNKIKEIRDEFLGEEDESEE